MPAGRAHEKSDHAGRFGQVALGRGRLQVAQAFEQVGSDGGERIAVAAVGQQVGFAQLFEAGVQGVGGDAAHAVLQQAKGLGVAVLQCPQHADGVAGLQQGQQLVDGDVFFGTHACSPRGNVGRNILGDYTAKIHFATSLIALSA
jgi:hypothetical protein